MADFSTIRFGKYLLLDKIATGGMAELFQAKITSVEGFEKLVAIKKILPNLTQDKNLVNMFIDEAKLAAILTHRNIVQIYDLGSIEGAYFIAMEYIHGKDLRTIGQKSREKDLPLPLEYALYITCRICAGLDYSHNLKDLQGNPLKLIHRDISPQNILISYEGEIKIVDFGIAKAAKKTSDTEEGSIMGKVAYMSPEQAAGKPIDKRSDIFSTGILLYEMVTGTRMFEEDSDLKVLDRVRKADFEPAQNIVPDLPPEVTKILNRSLAKAVGKRYKSCGAMLADLEDCLATFPARPSAESLSQYMKKIFAKEIKAEFSALQQAEVKVSTLKKLPVSEPKTKTKTLNILERIEPEPAKTPKVKSSTHRFWLGTWAVAMVVLVIIIGFLFKQRTSSTAYQDKSPESTQTSEIFHSRKSPAELSPTDSGEETATAEPIELVRAKEALGEKKFATAAALLEQVLASDTEDNPEVAVLYAKALVGGAASIVDTNEKRAAALLHEAIDIDPENAEAHFYLAKLYTSNKDYPKAIQSYDKAIDLDPHFPDSFFNLGFLYFSTKDYAKAEKMFQRTVELKPPYLDEVYYNLAVVQNLQDKKEESIGNLEKALEVNPGNKRAKKFLHSIKQTSQNTDGTKKSEDQGLDIAWAGTPLDHCRLHNSGKICAANQPKTTRLGQEV